MAEHRTVACGDITAVLPRLAEPGGHDCDVTGLPSNLVMSLAMLVKILVKQWPQDIADVGRSPK
jgi:hypothetical protein